METTSFKVQFTGLSEGGDGTGIGPKHPIVIVAKRVHAEEEGGQGDVVTYHPVELPWDTQPNDWADAAIAIMNPQTPIEEQ